MSKSKTLDSLGSSSRAQTKELAMAVEQLCKMIADLPASLVRELEPKIERLDQIPVSIRDAAQQLERRIMELQEIPQQVKCEIESQVPNLREMLPRPSRKMPWLVGGLIVLLCAVNFMFLVNLSKSESENAAMAAEIKRRFLSNPAMSEEERRQIFEAFRRNAVANRKKGPIDLLIEE